MTPFQLIVVRAMETGGWSLRMAEAESQGRLKRATLHAIMVGRSWHADRRTLDALAATLDIDREQLQVAHDATKAWRDHHLQQCVDLTDEGRQALDAHLAYLLSLER